ncbi:MULTISPECIES: hypothetical protein [Ramlibacter]|uniref:Uncharacterized protein n=1 Tax=Ramlibacter aquaticus TaxID=2780094 RepID=A0ABR9SGY8_9BURK|nr:MULTISPECIES: hypothetical protein [Ramlibacter]MBE7941620.1 hypothetical protein [Ramlibacter aquaticus]
MKVHTDRSILEELQDLYDLAVREHGRHARSSQIIGESLQAEQRRLGQGAADPKGVRSAGRPGRADRGGRPSA